MLFSVIYSVVIPPLVASVKHPLKTLKNVLFTKIVQASENPHHDKNVEKYKDTCSSFTKWLNPLGGAVFEAILCPGGN